MRINMRKLLSFPVMVLVLMIGFTSASFAAGPTWLPKGSQFNVNQHVYLDNKLTSGDHSVDLSGLDDALKAEGAKQGVEFYFIMTEKGDEPAIQGHPFGVDRLNDLIGTWVGQRNFPSDKFVVLLLVRSDLDWSKSSYAINTSPSLAARGVSVPTLKPVLDTYGMNNSPSSLLPRMPKAFAAKIASETTGQLVAFAEAQKQAEQQRLAEAERQRQAQIAAEQAARDHAEFMAKLPLRIAEIGIPSAILITLLILFLLYTSAKNAAAAALASWKQKFEPGNANYLEMEKSYWGFLSNQGSDWESRFKGETLALFKAAVKAYSDLSVRFTAAQALTTEVEKLIASANLFSIGKLKLAVAKLTVEPVKISGETLALEQRSMFGSLVSEATYAPGELLANMEDLFHTATTDCAQIKQSMAGAQTNAEHIKQLVATVADSKAKMEAAGLSFEPYEGGLAKLNAARDEFNALLQSDPLSAFSKSSAVERGVEALAATLTKAVAIKESFTASSKLVADARTKVTQARSQKADYSYPDGLDATGLPANTLLSEEGGNPDKHLQDADQHLEAGEQALLAGQLDKANQEKAAAEAAAARATTVITSVLDARKFVQQAVGGIHQGLSKLTAELPAAKNQVASLKASFLAKNYEGQPAKYDTAQAVADSIEAELAKVKKAFAEQRYLAAKALVQKTGADIEGARNLLVEVSTRLKQLEADRSHSRDTVAVAVQLSASVAAKLAANQFTTSAETDALYAAASPLVEVQKADVAKDITDWSAASAAADRLVTSLQAVDSRIASEKQAHDSATSAVATLRNALNNAHSYVTAQYTRQQAVDRYNSANQDLANLDAQLQVAKANWSSIASAAAQAKRGADDAAQLAANDHQAAQNALAAIQQAESYTGQVANKNYNTSQSIGGRYQTFGNGTSANVSTARGDLAYASRAFQAGQFEQAQQYAEQALAAAQQADADAAAAVAAMIAIQVQIWEDEQRRIREAEEARQRAIWEEQQRQERAEQARRDEQARQEQARRDEEARQSSWSNSSSSSGGSDSWGGGGSGGSDSNSGGGSGGGGDF
jgi:hypothetical protein